MSGRPSLPRRATGAPDATHLARRGLAVVGSLLLAAGLAACSDDAGAGCEPVRREPLDRRSVHILPGAPPPEYQTDPPTSGPHLPAPEGDAVRTEPIDPAVQVGLLEEGAVLLQHHGLSDDEQASVEALAGDGVVVAPAPLLPDDAAVVATAWVTKQVCRTVDVATLRAFADDHLDDGPGSHG